MIRLFRNSLLSIQSFQRIIDELCINVLLLYICIMYYIHVFVFHV